MKRLILSLFMALFLISCISAAQDSLGTYKQNEDIVLLQICGTCSYNNITSIVLPNATHIEIDQLMTSRGMEYTYVFTQTDLIGTYLVNGYGDLDGTNNAWAYEFYVTPNGFVNNPVFYFLILILSIGIIVIGLWKEDAIITVLGTFGLYFIGLYILFYGLNGMKDPVYTWAIGIIILGIAFYISVRAAYELVVD